MQRRPGVKSKLRWCVDRIDYYSQPEGPQRFGHRQGAREPSYKAIIVQKNVKAMQSRLPRHQTERKCTRDLRVCVCARARVRQEDTVF